MLAKYPVVNNVALTPWFCLACIKEWETLVEFVQQQGQGLISCKFDIDEGRKQPIFCFYSVLALLILYYNQQQQI